MNSKPHNETASLQEKNAELERVNDELFRLLNAGGIAKFLLDRDFRLRRASPAGQELLNLDASSLGRPITELVSALDDPSLAQDAESVLNGHPPMTCEVQNKTGQWFIRRLLPVFDSDQQIDGLALTLVDITGLKDTEQALRDSEAAFRFLAENAPDLVIRLDRELRHVYVNPLIEEITGIPRQDYIGKTNQELGMPEDLCKLWETEMRRTLEAGETRDVEFQFPGPSGPRTFEIRMVPETIGSESAASLLAISRDITQRKAMTAALAGSEQKFRNLAENIPGLVLKYQLFPDGSDALLFISSGVETLYEMPRELALDDPQSLWSRIHPDDLSAVKDSIAKSADALSFWEQKHRIVMPDGRVKWVHSRGVPTKKTDGSIVWDTLALDITESKSAEERLRKTEKFDAIQRMAGGLAEHFNDMLQASVGFLEMAIDALPEDEQALDDLRQSKKAATRAAKMSRLLLTILGRQPGTFTRFSLTKFANAIEDDLNRKLPSGSSLALSVPDKSPTVRASLDQLKQVLETLVENAAESAESDSAPTVSVSIGKKAAKKISASHRYPGHWEPADSEYAVIAVQDQGRGMHRDHETRIFDPFFSDKGHGRGLGLSVALGIIQVHDGCITVDSQPGAGTLMEIILPLAAEESENDQF